MTKIFFDIEHSLLCSIIPERKKRLEFIRKSNDYKLTLKKANDPESLLGSDNDGPKLDDNDNNHINALDSALLSLNESESCTVENSSEEIELASISRLYSRNL